MKARVALKPGAHLIDTEAHYHGLSGLIEVIPYATVAVGRRAIYRSDFSLAQGRVGKLDIDYEVKLGEDGIAKLNSKVYGHLTDVIRIREVVSLDGEPARGLVKTRVAVGDEASAEILGATYGNAAGARGHVDCLEIVRGQGRVAAIPEVRVSHPQARVTHQAAIGGVDHRQPEALMARGISPEEAVDRIVLGMLRLIAPVMSHEHDHTRGHSHDHSHQAAALPNLRLALLLTAGFAGVEALAGWWSGSLALLADAGHMVTDSASLGLAWLAAWLAARPPSPRHTYGLGRAEVLAAFINAAAMLSLVAVITAEAWGRFQTPRAIDGMTVSAVALVGLGVNLLVALILSRGERDLNVRAALLHVLGDTLGSLAAIASGLVIWATGWTPIDPLLSIVIGGLILASSVGLLKQSLHALLDGVPPDLPLEQVGKALAAVPGVVEVHDLHVWSLSSRRIALSAHVTLRDLALWPQTLSALRAAAAGQGIDHATFQPEIHTQTVRWPGRPRAHQTVGDV